MASGISHTETAQRSVECNALDAGFAQVVQDLFVAYCNNLDVAKDIPGGMDPAGMFERGLRTARAAYVDAQGILGVSPVNKGDGA